jgi:hypothetical protein
MEKLLPLKASRLTVLDIIDIILPRAAERGSQFESPWRHVVHLLLVRISNMADQAIIRTSFKVDDRSSKRRSWKFSSQKE